MASETLRRRCIDQDLDYIRAYSTGMPDLVHISVTSELNWNLKVRGRHGTYWAGMVYDLEIVFSRRHPFEAPVILLPQTQRNRANRTPPSDYISGRLYLPIVKPDNWLCTTRMIDVVQAILHVFSENSFTTPTGDSIAERLPTATVEYMLGFLPIPDICRFSRTCKASLAAVHSEEFWASLYYSRCKATNTLLNVMSHPGPLRVFTTRGQWSWCDSKESFIQAHQAQLYASQNMAVERILGLEILPLGLFLTNSEQHPDYSNLSSRCDRVQHIPDARFKRKWLRYSKQDIFGFICSVDFALLDFMRLSVVICNVKFDRVSTHKSIAALADFGRANIVRLFSCGCSHGAPILPSSFLICVSDSRTGRTLYSNERKLHRSHGETEGPPPQTADTGTRTRIRGKINPRIRTRANSKPCRRWQCFYSSGSGSWSTARRRYEVRGGHPDRDKARSSSRRTGWPTSNRFLFWYCVGGKQC